mgnify:CR=1 FL=1
MKVVYIVQVRPELGYALEEIKQSVKGYVIGDKLIREVILLNKEPLDFLTEQDLEEIFRVSNQTMSLSLTGWDEHNTFADYIVDVDWSIAYRCMPIGWKALI